MSATNENLGQYTPRMIDYADNDVVEIAIQGQLDESSNEGVPDALERAKAEAELDDRLEVSVWDESETYTLEVQFLDGDSYDLTLVAGPSDENVYAVGADGGLESREAEKYVQNMIAVDDVLTYDEKSFFTVTFSEGY